jgi:hypothetical protein
MSRKKKLLLIAAPPLALFIAASVLAFQVVSGGGTKETQSQTTSGLTGTLTFPDQIGTQTNSWEIIVNGSPATVAVTINGVMQGGTLTSLATSSATSNSVVSTSGGPYISFQVAYTLTGGSSPTLTVNRVGTSTSNKLGAVVGSVATVVNNVFGTNWVEAAAQSGGDIETKIANACTALAAKGAGGGFITVSFTGTLTGALGSNPFATCPDNSAPGNGTIVYFVSPPNGTILTSAPWLTTNKMRIYGGMGGRLARSWTTIKAGSAFKTMANLRQATLAQTTGLVRTGTGPFTVTATFTNTAGGTGCAGAGCGLEFTVGEPVMVGCSTHGDQSFVGIWVIQTASATNITYTQNSAFPWQSAYTAVGNTNGTCTIVGGTPLIGMAENGKDGSTNSGTLAPYGNSQSSACTGGTNCYGNATAAFGVGISGLTLDCDDLSPAVGCVALRNILSQEKTFADDLSIVNFNFIGMVLDNMSSSGLQNSGAYHDLELYVAPLADNHADNCDPVNFNDTTSNNNPIPVEGIFAIGLSLRSVHSYTMTMVSCGTHTQVNYNPGMIGAESNQTGNAEWGTGGTIHCEAWLVCVGVGINGPASGGTTIIGMGGAPTSTPKYNCTSGGCAGGTNYQTSSFNAAILISSSYPGTSDVTALNTRRNLGMSSSVINQFDGDTLNGAADAVTALYAWDVQGSNYLVETTSVTVPNRMMSLTVNRLTTTGNLPPSVACTGVGTGSCAVLSNSSDSIGAVQLTVAGGTGAATGVVTLTFSSALGGHVGSCVWTLSQAGTGAWLTGATPASVFDNGGGSTTVAKAVWYNQATALANNTYNLNYFCGGHN